MVQWLAHWTLNPIIRVQFSVCPFLLLIPSKVPVSDALFLLHILTFQVLIDGQDRIILFNSMESTIKMLEDHTSWKESMRKCCRNNKLNIQIVAFYTPLRFRAAYSKFKAIYEKKSPQKNERWIQNELKAFYWICVAVSCVKQVKIAQFSEKQWGIINEIFYFKQPLTLQYQGKKLVEDASVKLNWLPEEDEALMEIVQQSPNEANKWNEFARKLYESSEKRFYRTGKQCRERWLNHLDPSKKHGQWSKQQDIEVVKLFISDGKKWSQVAKKLGNQRTEHMVKNRFKTIISKQKKDFPKIKNEIILMKSFLEPQVAEKYMKKEKIQQQTPGIKVQHKSQEVQQFQSQNEQNLIREQQSLVRDPVEPSEKNQAHTSCAFQLPQVYSPWYVNIPITPTFSPSVPFFVNLSSFSAFDANYSNQFYCPRQASDKTEKIDHF